MTTEDKVIRRYVVLPFFTTEKGKKALHLNEVGDSAKGFPLVEGGSATFAVDKTVISARFAVGHVYEIPVTPDGKRFSLGLKKWLCSHPDGQMVETWQAKEKARKLVEESAALERREASSTSRLETHLKALRDARGRLTAPQRLAFDVWVLASIR